MRKSESSSENNLKRGRTIIGTSSRKKRFGGRHEVVSSLEDRSINEKHFVLGGTQGRCGGSVQRTQGGKRMFGQLRGNRRE